ncbi:hypothetical protein M2148_001696 [Lachnospiraceae bacterium PF1-4]
MMVHALRSPRPRPPPAPEGAGQQTRSGLTNRTPGGVRSMGFGAAHQQAGRSGINRRLMERRAGRAHAPIACQNYRNIPN